MKSYFLLLRLNLRNLLAGFRGAMRKPNGKIDISRLILYPLALLGMLTLAGFCFPPSFVQLRTPAAETDGVNVVPSCPGVPSAPAGPCAPSFPGAPSAPGSPLSPFSPLAP